MSVTQHILNAKYIAAAQNYIVKFISQWTRGTTWKLYHILYASQNTFYTNRFCYKFTLVYLRN